MAELKALNFVKRTCWQVRKMVWDSLSMERASQLALLIAHLHLCVGSLQEGREGVTETWEHVFDGVKIRISANGIGVELWISGGGADGMMIFQIDVNHPDWNPYLNQIHEMSQDSLIEVIDNLKGTLPVAGS